MSVVIDLPFGLSELDAVFAVEDLLSNTNELVKEFKPEVSKLLVRKGFFHGPFLRQYQLAFDELITSLIKKQIVKHFDQFTPEDVLLLTDTNFLKLIASPLFDPDNYQTKEGL